jgi:diguanylate cyclase (GGDEF)-like protein
MAARDSLTGLYNRRHFNDLCAQLFAEAARYQTDLTCMMIDLDNFKRVNDTLGHQTGDDLLRLTAEIIRGSIRESDVAVRYGGDEFAVLLPRTSPTEARASAERILARFREDIADKLPEASIASLSIGLVSREQDQPASVVELVNLADEALYLAKAGGKNRITVARPPALRA